jgi:hypothetical protein
MKIFFELQGDNKKWWWISRIDYCCVNSIDYNVGLASLSLGDFDDWTIKFKEQNINFCLYCGAKIEKVKNA